MTKSRARRRRRRPTRAIHRTRPIQRPTRKAPIIPTRPRRRRARDLPRKDWAIFLIDSEGNKIEAVPDVITEGPRTSEHAEIAFDKWLERNESWALEIQDTTRTLIDLGRTGNKRFQSPDKDDDVFLIENPSRRDYRVRVSER